MGGNDEISFWMEARRLFRIGLIALFRERLILTGLFLLIGLPILVRMRIRLIRDKSEPPKVSPFIYNMQ